MRELTFSELGHVSGGNDYSMEWVTVGGLIGTRLGGAYGGIMGA